jgi:predicted ABC-type ATPase
MEAGPAVLLLAGPNGAGKTTSSRLMLPDGVVYFNANIVARRLAREGHPAMGRDVAAGRIGVSEIRRLTAERASFCVETNLAGRGFVRSITNWHETGYQVRLAFIALGSPELALRRGRPPGGDRRARHPRRRRPPALEADRRVDSHGQQW